MARRHRGRVNAEVIRGIKVRPLRSGETEVVRAVFDRLGPRSRLLRFGGAKNVLLPGELEVLARVDGDHHVLVAWFGDEPVGIARLVRDGKAADVAFAVVDELQGNGVGTVLSQRLAEDARAAGIETLRATMSEENGASLALLKRMTAGMKVQCAAGQLEVVGRAA
jgi:GNAT superfamily N-acetyltransferase